MATLKNGHSHFKRKDGSHMIERGYSKDLLYVVFVKLKALAHGFPESHAANFALLVTSQHGSSVIQMRSFAPY